MWFLLIACVQLPADVASSEPTRAARTFRTLTVDCEGSTQFRTIDAALQASRSGDVVRVLPCRYEETVHFRGKSVQVVSAEGPERTVIVAAPNKPVVKVNDGEGHGTVVSGFTLTGGGATDEPAIEVQFSSLVLRDSLVVGNAGTSILYSNAGHVLVERTTFENNSASEPVIWDRRGTIALKDTVVRCATGDVGYLAEHDAAFIDGGAFHCPGGIAIDIHHADGRVQRAMVDGKLRVENELTEDEEHSIIESSVLQGGVDIIEAEVALRNVVSLGNITTTDSHVTIDASILTGASCAVSAITSMIEIRSTDLWHNTQDLCGDTPEITKVDTISADPRFVDAGGGNYRLSPGSPCIDAGPTATDFKDPDGSRNDLGAHGGPLSMGGGW